MAHGRLFTVAILIGAGLSTPAMPQATVPVRNSTDTSLTLDQAESLALTNQPRLLAAQLRSRAAAERIREARAGLLPTASFDATGAEVADTETATAAGNLTTSSLSNRFAYGGNLSQLVTDFGRTHALVASERANSEAQADTTTLTRAEVRLHVREAYYAVLGEESVLNAAQAALTNRQLVLRQLNVLEQNQLRSTLDVNFAAVLVSQAKLAVVQAQSEVSQARAKLATAMGESQPIAAALVDIDPAMEPLPPGPEDPQRQAQLQRADLSAARAQQKAAEQFAIAEKRLSFPTLKVLAAAGDIPYHDHTLHSSYAAAGFNLDIPVFNGGLFSARRAQAELQANARSEDTKELSLEVSEQVRDAWYRANEAFQSLDVSNQLVTQAREALRLAQDRYDSGLGSIVELNEAQLNETSAEINAASAVDTYLTRRAELDFSTGLLN
jgi:outer membrane protein